MSKDHKHIFYQLIARRDFVDWVHEPVGERNSFWEKWLQEHAEQKDEFLKAKEFVERLHLPQHTLEEDELDDLLSRVVAVDHRPNKPANDSRNIPHSRQWLRVAAILLFSLMVALLADKVIAPFQEETILEEVAWKSAENPRGRKSIIVLPDGSKVHLNYESKLRFPEHFNTKEREVILEGEAFFEVTHDASRPFTVTTGSLQTQVLGTSFNVKSDKYTSDVKVSLVTGKVKVRMPDLPDNILVPGEELQYQEQEKNYSKSEFDVQAVTAWKDGVIVFKDTQFEAFIDRLGKWYGVDFQVYGETPKDWKINGRYENEKLEDILTGLQFMYDVKYKIDDKNVTLKF
ncbi:FecR family protein [Echinicola sp. 20G]|uniref:FecR family protein n=1 Tax=Echinicola sp. 20G TaxID=2781961 RepID=UPI00190FD370|nr:FecR domain-containing protein [Echinicola sp. 20G]